MTPATERKAARILTSGRLKVTSLADDRITATCFGNTAAYEVGHDPGGWYCSCPARRECSHVRALRLIVVWNLRRPT